MSRAAASSEGVHVALLRGINVGGKHSVPMARLAETFEEAGARDVRTYIQSGNVVFRAPPRRASGIPARVTRTLRERLGFDAPVVLRSLAEIRTVVRGNPFLRRGAEPGELHVLFLAARPTAAQAARLDPRRSPPDEIAARGREVYLRLPHGTARTKYTNAYFDAQLGTTTTLRNWRTVLALLAMAEAP